MKKKEREKNKEKEKWALYLFLSLTFVSQAKKLVQHQQHPNAHKKNCILSNKIACPFLNWKTEVLAFKLMQQRHGIVYMSVELEVDYMVTKRQALYPSQMADKSCRISRHRILGWPPICLSAVTHSQRNACLCSTHCSAG